MKPHRNVWSIACTRLAGLLAASVGLYAWLVQPPEFAQTVRVESKATTPGWFVYGDLEFDPNPEQLARLEQHKKQRLSPRQEAERSE